MVDQATVERALRRAHEAGDVEAARIIAREWTARQATPAPAPEPAPATTRSFWPPSQETMVGQAGVFGPSFAAAGTPEGDAAYRAGVQQHRETAASVVPMVTTTVGTALGAPAGIPGMMAGGAAGAALGEHLAAPVRGAPQPGLGETVTAAASGAISGAAGGLAGKAVNAFARAFQAKPNVKLSLEMQQRARAVEDAHLAERGIARGKGYKSEEARKLYRESKALELIEGAITRARGNPDRIRQNFTDLIQRNNKVLARLTNEQQALLQDVTRQPTIAGMLRSVGSLRDSMLVGGGVGLVKDPVIGGTLAAGQLAAGAVGRAMDRTATHRLVDAAVQGISGVAPVRQAAPAFLSPVAAGGARPVVDPTMEALIQILGAPERPTKVEN